MTAGSPHEDSAYRGAVHAAATVGRVSLRASIARVSFGLVWAIDAGLKWRPSFIDSFAAQVTAAGAGQPGWLHAWFRFWSDAVTRAPRPFAYTTALVESIIAAALILGVGRRPIYLLGMLWSLAIWSVPEGFGGPYTADSTDIGTGISYAFFFLFLYAIDAEAGAGAGSLDQVLERRAAWWRTVARPRRHP